MNNLIHVNFRTRTVSAQPTPKPQDVRTERSEGCAVGDEPTTPREWLFYAYDRVIKQMQSRFGTEQPRGGVVYKVTPTAKGFDTYGRGCVHNSIHQYAPQTQIERELWNRPGPFPADLRAIERLFKKSKGRTIKVGLKSDPFMWMDQKYGVTKATIQLATNCGVRLELHTMSDLCGHEDYATLLALGGHSIVMHMGFDHYRQLSTEDAERVERVVSPGAPSLLRRLRALERLGALKVKYTLAYTHIEDLIKDPVKLRRLCLATGTGSEVWSNPKHEFYLRGGVR